MVERGKGERARVGQSTEREMLAEFPMGSISAVVAQMSDGVLLSCEGDVLRATGRAAQLLGRASAEELRGHSLRELFSDLGQGLPGLRIAGEIECGITGLEASGRTLWVSRMPTISPAEQGEVWLLKDRTQQTRLREELLQVSRELYRANREVMALRQRVSTTSEEREDLLNVVSHELRTPVTVIAGYTRMLLSGEVGELSEDQRRFLEESRKSCERLNRFIGNLLDASREGSVESSLEPTVNAISDTIREVIDFIRPLLEARGLSISVEVDEAAVWAKFDSTRIGQVLTNLLGNAIKFSAPGSVIRVATAPIRAAGYGFVEVRVIDRGPGVPRSDRDRIFEPYVRASGESEAGGLGLGLAICKRIVEAHGGGITVADEPSGGSCFAFTLPAVRKLQEAS